MVVVIQVHHSVGSFFEFFGATKNNGRMYPFFCDDVNTQDLLNVFHSHMPRQKYDTGGDEQDMDE